jgi:protein phosphatase-4 regulatory subunit 3
VISLLVVSLELRCVDNCNLPALTVISIVVADYGNTDQMRLTELMLKNQGAFFQKLIDVFDDCENRKDIDGLHMMFNIVKEIISVNNYQILEIILGDQLFMKIFGCLEYDPDVPQSKDHRTSLRKNVVFVEDIPIKNPLVLSKIHQTYRIDFLKDVVLTDVLDVATSAFLDSVINANKATVSHPNKQSQT